MIYKVPIGTDVTVRELHRLPFTILSTKEVILDPENKQVVISTTLHGTHKGTFLYVVYHTPVVINFDDKYVCWWCVDINNCEKIDTLINIKY